MLKKGKLDQQRQTFFGSIGDAGAALESWIQGVLESWAVVDHALS
jgi:hypothetical protein